MASLLAEVAQNPAKIRRYMARLATIEAAIASAERTQLTKPGLYDDTASATYTKAEVQGLMDQLQTVTTTQRQIIDLVTLILSDLREIK